MKAYFDIEFIPKKKNAIFASIGIVRDDGRELHMVSSEFDPHKGGWYFMKNVWRHMEHEPCFPVAQISRAVQEILAGVTLVVTRDGGCDRKLLEWLIGPLTMSYCDLERCWYGFGKPVLPKRTDARHNALEDARWHRTLFEHIFHPVLAAA